MSEYRVAFDLASAGYKTWWFPTLGLLFVAVGLGLFRYQGPARSARARRVVSVFFIGFSCLWMVTSYVGTYLEYRRLRTAYETGHYQVIEGIVEQFRYHTPDQPKDESFSVNGVHFIYDESQVTAAFNQTSGHGGPIREGLAVRVWYVGNAIIRLEVADGRAPNNAGGTS